MGKKSRRQRTRQDNVSRKIQRWRDDDDGFRFREPKTYLENRIEMMQKAIQNMCQTEHIIPDITASLLEAKTQTELSQSERSNPEPEAEATDTATAADADKLLTSHIHIFFREMDLARKRISDDPRVPPYDFDEQGPFAPISPLPAAFGIVVRHPEPLQAFETRFEVEVPMTRDGKPTRMRIPKCVLSTDAIFDLVLQDFYRHCERSGQRPTRITTSDFAFFRFLKKQITCDYNDVIVDYIKERSRLVPFLEDQQNCGQVPLIAMTDTFAAEKWIMNVNCATANPSLYKFGVMECLQPIYRASKKEKDLYTSNVQKRAPLVPGSVEFCCGCGKVGYRHNENSRAARDIAEFERCSRCSGPVYCSSECQEADWKAVGGHKKECNKDKYPLHFIVD